MDQDFARMANGQAQVSYGQKSADAFWPVFRDLIEARSAFGLARPVLSTLRAMISFMERGTVVFASNRKLCERAEGISQSSLRRHIRALVDAGLARRVDSPNGKRYAMQTQGIEDLAFGIDLQPLLARASDITAAMIAFRQTNREIRHLRKILGQLIWRLEQRDTDHPLLEPMRRALRQKLQVEDYRLLCDELSVLLASFESAEEMAATSSQNDCHKINIKQEIRITDSEILADDAPVENQAILLRKAQDLMPKAFDLIPERVETWADLRQQTPQIAEWTGIARDSFHRATQRSGQTLSVMAALFIVQNIDRIRKPSAYFHALTTGNRRRSFAAKLTG